jgi:hypothetical protein
MVLKPGSYTLSYTYRTIDIPGDTGIRWQIIDGRSDITIAESADLSSSDLKQSSQAFTVPPDVPLMWLRLVYRRTLGTPRIAGTLVVISTKVKVNP